MFASKLLDFFSFFLNNQYKDFPGDPVVKNPPANVRDAGSILSLGRFHTPWSS